MKNLMISALLLAGFVSASHAADEPMVADIDAGKAKTAVCAACHGAEGISAIPDNPSLAGQVPGYIASQLQAFKSGARENAIMAGQAAGLTEQDMLNIDAYYSSLAPNVGSINEDQLEQAQAGEKIYRGGIAKYNVAACTSCHGPTGSGVAPLFPRIAGQSTKYLETQLLAYKSGARKNAMMNSTAFSLSEQQIKDLALYISALQ